jgi:hypothetical protein
MLLESQIQYILWYSFLLIVVAVVAILAFLIAAVGIEPVVSTSIARTLWLGVVFSTAVGLKLAFEWSRIRGERQLTDSDESFTANFAPTPPE